MKLEIIHDGVRHEVTLRSLPKWERTIVNMSKEEKRIRDNVHIASRMYGPPETTEFYRTEVVPLLSEIDQLREIRTELLDACKRQHEALDIALAMLIEAKRDFYPSQSAMWPAIVLGSEVIRKAEGRETHETTKEERQSRNPEE